MRQIACFFIILVGFVFCYTGVHAQNNSVVATSDTKISVRVKWDGKIIPGITKVSELRRKTEVVMHRTGGDPSLKRRFPGATSYEPIIIERPRSGDQSFEQWANKVWNLGAGSGAEVSLKDFRKDVIIELVDPHRRVVMAFFVYRCWPSDYIALSKFDENSDEPAMEVLVLQHEGWQRDYDIK